MLDSRQLLQLSRHAFRGWRDDAAPSMGAALAFYVVLTLTPLLLVAVGLAGFFLGRDEAQNALIAQVSAMLGDGAAFGIESLLDAAGSRDEGLTPALVGGVTMLLGAIAIFAELRRSLDRIWKCPAPAERKAWKELAVLALDFALVTAVGLLLVASLLASTYLAAVHPRALDGSPFTLHAMEFMASFIGITALFAIVFKVVPTPAVGWRDVWLGAAATSLLFWLGKLAVAFYIGRAAIDSGFGAAGAVVVVVLWAYYSAQAFFAGAEITRHFALLHGSRRGEVAAAPTLSEMNAAYEELVERARRKASGKLLGSDSN